MEEIEWWIAEIPKVRHVPWAPALFFPERGHPRRVYPEMDASGNIGFGAACPLPGGIVLLFYGKWTQQELALHINEKEASSGAFQVRSPGPVGDGALQLL